MLNHILITYEGKDWLPVQSVFKNIKVKALNQKATLPSDAIVWFKVHMQHAFAEQIDQLVLNYRPQQFIVLSNQPNPKEAVYAMAKGARAYTNAHAGPKTLKQISEVIASGNIWLGHSMMQSFVKIVNQKQPTGENTAWHEGLTQREVEVATLLKQGLSNKLIARELNITERTVKAHIAAIFQKKGVKDRLHLALLLAKN